MLEYAARVCSRMYPRMLACATLGVRMNEVRSGACPLPSVVRALTCHPRSPAVRARMLEYMLLEYAARVCCSSMLLEYARVCIRVYSRVRL